MCLFRLRPYQLECLDLIKKEIEKGTKNILIQAATGAGKTVILSRLINDLGVKALVVVNKKVLVKQTVRSLERYSSDIGIYSASFNQKDLSCKWTVASIQSLVRHKEDLFFDLIIVDECHSINLKHFDKLNYKNLLGVTATPFTGKGNFIFGSNKFFDKPIFKATFKYLTDLGFLAPIRTKGSAKKLDISQVSLSTNGDYNQKELEEAIEGQLDKVEGQVKDALSRSHDRKKVAFICCNISHCQMVYDLLPPGSASMTHSRMKEADQQYNIKQFESGKRRFLVSVMQVTTGYDYPALDCLVLMRPTRSPVLYCQSVGRIARLAPGKDYGLLLDYGGVVEYMGDIYNVQLKPSKDEDSAKMCVSCEEMNDMAAPKCVECGEVFLVMCKQCLDMYPYGQGCSVCPPEKQDKDFTKNLTDQAWVESIFSDMDKKDMTWSDCKIKAEVFISKNNQEFLRITANQLFNRATTIFSSWSLSEVGHFIGVKLPKTKDKHEVARAINNAEITAKEVVVRTNGEYLNIQSITRQ